MTDTSHNRNCPEEVDPRSAEQLLALVYEDLRKLAARRLANESSDHTLQATALVHEAYLRLTASAEGRKWDDRRHFFAAAAEAMRRILVDRARAKRSQRRGGGLSRRDIEHVEIATAEPSPDVLAVHEALARFEQIDKLKADLVKLRYFGGFSIPDAADALGISSATADRYWAYARAWLHAELRREKDRELDCPPEPEIC